MIQKPSENSKLLELRAQTDRQLVVLINRRLDRGFTSARHEEVDQLCAEVSRLLPVINNSSDRTRLESRLSELAGSRCYIAVTAA